jgi:hypothetical protein
MEDGDNTWTQALKLPRLSQRYSGWSYKFKDTQNEAENDHGVGEIGAKEE